MKKQFIFTITLVITSLALSIFAPKTHAFITERSYERVYEVQDSYLLVKEKKTLKVVQPTWYIPEGSAEVFTIFNPIEGDPNAQNKRELTLSSLKAFDSNSNSLPYTLENTPKGNTLVSIKIPRQIRFGESYVINISYNSYGLLVKNGGVRDAYIPAFSEKYIFETESNKEIISTRLIIAKSYGEINFSLPKGDFTTTDVNNIIDFDQASLVGETGWVQIGNEQFYTYQIEQEYLKSSSFPFLFNTYKVIIPRELKSGFITQKVYFTEIIPEPTKIEPDEDGNLIAYFKIPALDSGKIIIKGFASIKEDLNIDLTDSGTISDIPIELVNKNTADGKYWEVNSADIKKVALELKGEETDVYKLVEKTYKYVVDKIDYSDVKRFGINNRQGALKTLQGGAAVCMEYSDLFITLLRAMGIPARGAFGYGYSSLDYESISDGTINHQWAEFYLPKADLWVPADTTWGESGDFLVGGDLNHFYSHVASVNPEIPSTVEVQFYGSSPKLPERVMDVNIVEKAEFANLIGMNQSEVLAKYKLDDSENQEIKNILDSLNLFWSRSDDVTKTIVILVGLLFIILPIFLIIASLIRKLLKRFRKKSYSDLNLKMDINEILKPETTITPKNFTEV